MGAKVVQEVQEVQVVLVALVAREQIGKDGLEGLGIFYSTNTSTSTSTVSITKSTINIPSDRTLKAGDLIINAKGNLYKITSVSSSSVSTTYVTSLVGPKGDPGTNATTTSVATTSSNGLMSYNDKKKLDSLPTMYKGSYTYSQSVASKTPVGVTITVPSGYQNCNIFTNLVASSGSYSNWITILGARWLSSTSFVVYLFNHGDGSSSGSVDISYLLVK